MLTITVYGTPAPQGSKRHVGNGRMIESSKKVAPWRQDVKAAAIAARNGAPPLDGPLAMSVTFTLPKPASAPKKRRTYPDRKPDIDKLLRSTLDALVQAGAIADDARIIDVRAMKMFPGEHTDAIDVPGARIMVWRVLA